MDQVPLDHAAPGKKADGHLRDRAMWLMQVEHQERRRMGQVLHEDVMQILSAVGMFVHSGDKDTPQSPAIAKALALLEDALRKLRHLTRRFESHRRQCIEPVGFHPISRNPFAGYLIYAM
ncbi:MAG: hypothetical protein A3K18_12800 [Lentisphaerae bacterium RIFOXYA12_64_32]|nr:MAG: hypothetical protein A3K18_12800 [Lentisphaerae bacterium RIFOXYA12_64_32]